MTSWYIRKTEILNIYVHNKRHKHMLLYVFSYMYTFSVFIYVCLYVCILHAIFKYNIEVIHVWLVL